MTAPISLALCQLGVVADDPGLVLEVELDGVDQAAVDEVLDRRLAARRRPTPRRSTCTARRGRRGSRRAPRRASACGCRLRRSPRTRANRWAASRSRPRSEPSSLSIGLAVEPELHVLLHLALDRDGLVDRHGRRGWRARRARARCCRRRSSSVKVASPRNMRPTESSIRCSPSASACSTSSFSTSSAGRIRSVRPSASGSRSSSRLTPSICEVGAVELVGAVRA